MVNKHHKRCSHQVCTKIPSFQFDGKTTTYCRQHAEDGMVNIRNKRRSHDSCTGQAVCGVPAGGGGTACADRKRKSLNSPTIHSRALCKVAGCEIVSTWGLSGKMPSHCCDHGPLEDGLVLAVRTSSTKTVRRRSSYSASGNPSFHVKAERSF